MTFLIVLFVLMMQFLWLYIDELVGKGLSLGVILEFLGFIRPTIKFENLEQVSVQIQKDIELAYSIF